MKKLFVSVLAIAALVACNNEQTLVQKGNAPMEFGASFVENATRAADPSTTTNTLEGFDVWGFMDNTSGIVFEGEDVTKGANGWSYQNAQYWTPGHVYYFAAIAPMNSANWSLNTAEANLEGAGEISFTNVNGTEDLLYAATSVSTMDLAVGADPGKVKFQFNHMLSKVKFSFTNGFQNDNAYITVKNIRMEVPAQGSINVAQDWWSENKWVLGEGKTILDFGNMEAEMVPYNEKTECQFERLTIPAGADQVYNVTFDVALYMGTVEAYAATLTTEIKGAELKIGRAYNFHAEINDQNIVPGENPEDALKKIEFDVTEVKEWENGNGYEGGQIQTGLYEKQIRDILAAGGVVELSQDLVVTESLVVAAGKEAVINLNGYDIINATDSEELGEGDGIIVYGNLTINGEGTVQGKTRCVWARGNDNPTVTINGGNYVGAVGGSTCEVIYASGNGKINIYGGTFQAETQDNVSFAAPQYAVLNLYNNGAAGNDIVVYGGSFKNFNPADNISENPKKNFCGEGCESVADGDCFVVRPVITSKADILAHLANGVTEFDANGKEFFEVLDRALTTALVPAGVTVTFKNATFKGQNYNNCIDGDVVFENCVFHSDDAYSINFGSGNGHVTFKDCTLIGWNSFGNNGGVTMERCKLEGNGTYALIRSYSLLHVTDCVFDLRNANTTDKWPETVEAINLVEENCQYIR